MPFASIIIWIGITALGTTAFGIIALARGESISSVWLLTAAICTYLVAYRFYSRFVANKVLKLNNDRATPAVVNYDGKDFVPTNKWVLFGHHFAAIAGAGPLVGPTLAAQMGYLPGTIWIIVGAALAGCVQDFITLFGSMRRNGKSLGQIAKEEIGPVSGSLALVGVLVVMVIIMAALAMVVVNALAESPWATFSIFMTMPIAILMGIYMHYIRPGRILEVSCAGLLLLFITLWWGQSVAASPVWGPVFTFTKEQLAWIIISYGFIASVLPVWLLLAPRDYLSAFLKIGTIFALAIGILLTLPPIQMPALTQFIDGSGPVFGGALFPFLFVTIACGAVSGFHSLIASGTTPKLIMQESDARMIGYGAMLMESLVAIMALIAACILSPGVYFAINSPAAIIGADITSAAQTISSWGFVITPDQLTELANAIGEKTILSRTGGAPSLAIGMATIFTQLSGGILVAFWYHFAILFEAVFILTAVDAGTRVGRFMVQDMLGNIIPKMKQTGWLPGNLVGSAIIAGCWGYFVLQGVIDPLGGIYTFWPLFGIANQMLAAIAFAVGTTILFKMGRERYSWVTLLPMIWLVVTTFTAGWQKLFHANPKIGFLAHANYFKQFLAENTLPMGVKTVAAAEKMIMNDYVNTAVCASLMLITLIVILDSIRIWIGVWSGRSYPLHESTYVPFQNINYTERGYLKLLAEQHAKPDAPRCC